MGPRESAMTYCETDVRMKLEISGHGQDCIQTRNSTQNQTAIIGARYVGARYVVTLAYKRAQDLKAHRTRKNIETTTVNCQI